MTQISADAAARREAARDRGRFGVQEHTAPELTVNGDLATMDDLWERRQATSAAVARTDVALFASRLPEDVHGVRFTVEDGKIHPSQALRTSAADTTPVSEQLRQDIEVIAAYAQVRSQALELTPVHDGTGSWDWIPDADDRAVPVADAETANAEAREEHAAATGDLDAASEEYLTTRIPDGIHSLDIAYRDDGQSVTAFAYDTAGDPVPFDYHSNAWSDYRLILNRSAAVVGRIAERRQSDILGAYFHLTRS